MDVEIGFRLGEALEIGVTDRVEVSSFNLPAMSDQSDPSGRLRILARRGICNQQAGAGICPKIARVLGNFAD